MVKFVVDIERDIIAVGGEVHADAEAVLLENDSKQQNLWGANFYLFEKDPTKRIRFISLINIRPRDKNFKMKIKDPAIRERVQKNAEKLLSLPDESLSSRNA